MMAGQNRRKHYSITAGLSDNGGELLDNSGEPLNSRGELLDDHGELFEQPRRTFGWPRRTLKTAAAAAKDAGGQAQPLTGSPPTCVLGGFLRPYKWPSETNRQVPEVDNYEAGDKIYLFGSFRNTLIYIKALMDY